MSLQNLQAEFIDSIFDGNVISPAYPEKNMQMYANNIETNMVTALTCTYTMIQQILGNNFFMIAAKEYVNCYPSRSPDLNEYGEYFDSFISEFEPAKDFVYLAEVARFEWACHSIYLAPDHASLDNELMSNINEANYAILHFTLNPACRVERFMYPIIDIIDLCKHKRNENVDLDKDGVNLLIIRRGTEIKLQQLSDPDYVFLSHLQDNMPLAVALEEALAIDSEFSLKEMLSVWIKNQIIVDCQLISGH